MNKLTPSEFHTFRGALDKVLLTPFLSERAAMMKQLLQLINKDWTDVHSFLDIVEESPDNPHNNASDEPARQNESLKQQNGRLARQLDIAIRDIAAAAHANAKLIQQSRCQNSSYTPTLRFVA